MTLSIAIAHTHTEQANRPIITLLTIQWACQNRVKIDRSDGATSGGIMIRPFGSVAAASPADAKAEPLKVANVARSARQPSRSRVKIDVPLPPLAAAEGGIRIPREK